MERRLQVRRRLLVGRRSRRRNRQGRWVDVKGSLSGCLFILLRRVSDVLEMGVLEEGWVFEAVAEKAVEEDVGGPDEG